MVAHIKKVKSVSLLGRHRCRMDANVVEGNAVSGPPDEKGEVLREPRLRRELEGQCNDWRHILPLAIATEHDLGEDFSGEKCLVELEAYRGDFGSKCRFHNPVDLLRMPLDYVRGVEALDDLARGHGNC